MTDLSLLVMAAGRGSRYGGLKQVDPVGPHGETIMEYSIFDALRAGFSRVVLIIRRDIEQVIREQVGRRLESVADVHYVFQDEMLPPDPASPRVREKPWGTAHAVLGARDVVHGPFAVINADDFYGASSYRLLRDHLAGERPDAALVGYRLRNTLSEFGAVKRGLCRVTDGMLTGVAEADGLERDGDAAVMVDADGVKQQLTGDEIVSMNMWGFGPGFLDFLAEQWAEFARAHGDSETAEFYIPTAVETYISGGGHCRVLPTSESWFGVTYREDRPAVVDSLARLVAEGRYPSPLPGRD